jgi:hypothetical protein
MLVVDNLLECRCHKICGIGVSIIITKNHVAEMLCLLQIRITKPIDNAFWNDIEFMPTNGTFKCINRGGEFPSSKKSMKLDF